MSIIDSVGGAFDRVLNRADDIVTLKAAFDPPANASRTPPVKDGEGPLATASLPPVLTFSLAAFAVAGSIYFLTRKK